MTELAGVDVQDAEAGSCARVQGVGREGRRAGGLAIRALAREPGLVEQAVRKWVKGARRELNPPGAKAVTSEQMELTSENRRHSAVWLAEKKPWEAEPRSAAVLFTSLADYRTASGGGGGGLPGGGGGMRAAEEPDCGLAPSVNCPYTGTRCPFAYMHWMYAWS